MASSSPNRGAVLWKNAARINREGGVMSPGNPCRPLPPPKAFKSSVPTYHDKNKVLIVGDMAEGGVNTVEQHMQLVDVIKKVNPKVVIFCGEQIKVVWNELKRELPTAYYKSVNDLLPELNSWIKDGDAVFVKASHSIELFKITSAFRNSIKK